jgi:uncharacterized protein YggE
MTLTKPLPAVLTLLLITAGVAACGGTVPHSARPPARSTAGASASARASLAASVAAPPSTATVTAQGTGTVSGQPDTLTIGIGVSTTAPHAAGALSQNNTIAAAVQAALEKDGVVAADIQTTGLSLQQNWGNNGPAGYAVYDEVTATVHNLATAGNIIDDALAPAGDSGRLDEVNLSFADTDPLMASARAQAVQSAQAQATQMAAAVGGHLGALESLTDVTPQQSGTFAEPLSSDEQGPAAAPAVPVQAGTQQVSVQVTGVWRVVSGS